MTVDLDDVLKPLRGAAEEVERGFKRSAINAFVAGAAHALTHPIILRTPEELDALPMGAVVMDRMNRTYVQTVYKDWRSLAEGYAMTPDGLVIFGPVELIRLPAAEPIRLPKEEA